MNTMKPWKVVVLGMAGAFFGVMLLAGMAFWADIFKVDQNGVIYLRVTDAGNVGIGNPAPDPGSRLVVRSSGTGTTTSALDVQASDGTSRVFVRDDGYAGLGTTNPDRKLSVFGADAFTARIEVRRYSSVGAAGLNLSAWGGTESSPSAINNRDIGIIGFAGYDGSADSDAQAAIWGNTSELWSTTSTPANLRFETTPSGSITRAERMRITESGNVGIGTPDQFGTGAKVIGIANATTAPTTNPTGGGVLYSDAGALKWRGSSGTVTTMAPAEPHCPVCGRDFVVEWTNEKYGHLMVCMWCFTENFGNGKGVFKKEVGR